MSIQGFCPTGEEEKVRASDSPVKGYGYLDIETTGCCRWSELTVVGVGLVRGSQQQFGQLYGGQINADAVLGCWRASTKSIRTTAAGLTCLSSGSGWAWTCDAASRTRI